MHNVRPPLSVLTALSRVDRVRVRVQQDTEAMHVNNVQRGSFQAAAIASNVVSIHTLQLDKVRVLRVQQARSRWQERCTLSRGQVSAERRHRNSLPGLPLLRAVERGHAALDDGHQWRSRGDG